MISGSADVLNQPKTVLISESTAKRLFGTADAVGQSIFKDKQSSNNEWTIGGVYKISRKRTDKKLDHDAQRSQRK